MATTPEHPCTTPYHLLIGPELTIQDRARFWRQILVALRSGHDTIVLDFRRCRRIDDAGLEAIVRAAARSELLGCELRLEHVRHYILARAEGLRELPSTG